MVTVTWKKCIKITPIEGLVFRIFSGWEKTRLTTWWYWFHDRSGYPTISPVSPRPPKLTSVSGGFSLVSVLGSLCTPLVTTDALNTCIQNKFCIPTYRCVQCSYTMETAFHCSLCCVYGLFIWYHNLIFLKLPALFLPISITANAQGLIVMTVIMSCNTAKKFKYSWIDTNYDHKMCLALCILQLHTHTPQDFCALCILM